MTVLGVNITRISSCTGTSHAAPIVAGVCALIKSINPNLTAAQIQDIIKSTTDPIADASQYPGLIGTGRINAYKAVSLASCDFSPFPEPSITGTNIVCTSEATFTLNNRIPGASIDWTKSSNLIYVSGQETDNYTVKANSSTNEPGWIQAEISCIDCEPLILKKNVWVGKPDFTLIGETQLEPKGPGISFVNDINGNLIQPESIYNPQITAVDWSYNGPLDYLNGDTEKARYRAGIRGGYGTIYANATNQCGSLQNSLNYEVTDIFFKTYPNPANEYLEIEITDEQFYNTKSEAISVSLYNKQSSPVYNNKSFNKTTKINTRQFSNGLYLLQEKYKGKVYSKHIIIEH